MYNVGSDKEIPLINYENINLIIVINFIISSY